MFCVCLDGNDPSTERHGGEEIENTCAVEKARGRGWGGGGGGGRPGLPAAFSVLRERALLVLFHDQ